MRTRKRVWGQFRNGLQDPTLVAHLLHVKLNQTRAEILKEVTDLVDGMKVQSNKAYGTIGDSMRGGRAQGIKKSSAVPMEVNATGEADLKKKKPFFSKNRFEHYKCFSCETLGHIAKHCKEPKGPTVPKKKVKKA